MMEAFQQLGWAKFTYDDVLMNWVNAARPLAISASQNKALKEQWLRCGGTWFVGVNALPNGPDGTVLGASLNGKVIDFAKVLVGGDVAWDAAQISICYQGYPKPWEGENDAGFRFRKNRDAAHVDGLHKTAPGNRRFVNEFHQFILGIALNSPPQKAAPFVVWNKSHLIMKEVFQTALGGLAPHLWSKVDLTDVYKEARKLVFNSCERLEISAKPGEAYIVHRHALHGVAPWPEQLVGSDEGRAIAYFRPENSGDVAAWLQQP